MDVMKIMSGNAELRNAIDVLKRAVEGISEGMQTEDPLRHALDSTEQGWQGDELSFLEQHLQGLEEINDRLSNVSADNYTAWKSLIPSGAWPFLEPIAADVCVVTLTNEYFSNEKASIAASDVWENFESSIRSYVVWTLIDREKKGINVSIEDIISKCDLDGYAEWIEDSGENKEKLAYTLLSHFLDVILEQDGYRDVVYDINEVYSRIQEHIRSEEW